MDTLAYFILKSAQRIKAATEALAKKPDPGTLKAIRRESTILVIRAWRLWWRVRV
jgi:hypothetical protein